MRERAHGDDEVCESARGPASVTTRAPLALPTPTHDTPTEGAGADDARGTDGYGNGDTNTQGWPGNPLWPPDDNKMRAYAQEQGLQLADGPAAGEMLPLEPWRAAMQDKGAARAAHVASKGQPPLLISSGVGSHFVNDASWLHGYEPFNSDSDSNAYMTIADGRRLKMLGEGKLRLHSEEHDIATILSPVYYVPDLDQNLLS